MSTIEEDDGNDDDLVYEQQLHSSKGKGIRNGSMNKFVTKTKHAIKNQTFEKGECDKLIQQIARFFYSS